MTELSKAEQLKELSRFYDKEIKPKQGLINKNRIICSINYSMFVIIFVSALLLFFVKNIFILFLFFIPVIVLLLVNMRVKDANDCQRYGSDYYLKKQLMPKFLKILGDDIQCDQFSSSLVLNQVKENMKRYKLLSIMNPYLLLAIDDVMWGNYKGVKFYLIEACTSFFASSNLLFMIVLLAFMVPISFIVLVIFIIFICNIFTNVIYCPSCIFIIFLGILVFAIYKIAMRVSFRGILVDFDMNKKFEGETIILERNKTTRGIKIDKTRLQEVVLEDPIFMNKYIVYSDNQVEARYLLTTSFIERFNNIQVAFKAKFIRASFKDKKITISINSGKNLFSMVDFWKDTNLQSFLVLFEELYSVLNLIESFKLNQKIGL